MTSHLDDHTTTDVKLEMLSCVQTGNGITHDEYNIRGIANVRRNRKDNIFMQRRLYIVEVHTALDIFHFAVFLHLITIVVMKNYHFCPPTPGSTNIPKRLRYKNMLGFLGAQAPPGLTRFKRKKKDKLGLICAKLSIA